MTRQANPPRDPGRVASDERPKTRPTVEALAPSPGQAAARPAPGPARVDPNGATVSWGSDSGPAAAGSPDGAGSEGEQDAWRLWQAMNAADAELSISPGDSLTGGAPLVRKVAQFVLLERLGVGGMGVVFAAFDEKLERKVAIKLVTAQGALAQERLLREAQAQARLSHPNVVTVYEVGALPDGRLFIAMELVKGQTLRAWQRDAKRSWQDVLTMYTEAGRGLAAAHRGGIVHRDFKPDNILVGDDGRVRVADFGLAFAADSAALAEGSDPARRPGGEHDAEEAPASVRMIGAARPLTAAGAVAGTPGYMAPEQFAGAAVDGRTDQFSFCVSLFEGLHHLRPYADLAFATGTGEDVELRKTSPDPLHPRWLWDALMRGLSIDREQRFPSMDALLAELTRNRDRARRRVWAVGGGLAMVAMVGVTASALRGPGEPPRCPLATSELAGVWDGAVRQRISTAVSGLAESFAAKVWNSTEVAMDQYAKRWLAGHQAACAATHVRHVQSAELLDLRMECLAARKRSWAAAVDVLQSRPAQALAHAADLLSSLGDLTLCADTGVLLEQGRRPGGLSTPVLSPAQQAQKARVQQELARVSALLVAGEVKTAEDTLRRAEREVQGLADEALRAELSYAQGRVKLARSEMAESIALMLRAVDLAVAARQDDLAVDIWLTLARDAGLREQRPLEIEAWLGQGEAWLRRLSHAGDSRRIAAAHARGTLQLTAGKAAESLVTLTDALAQAEHLWGAQSARLVAVLRDRAWTFARLRRAKEAVADAERALALGLAAWGPTYPDISSTRRALGLLYVEQLGDLARGEQQIELALQADEAHLGPASFEVAHGQQMLSQVALYRGDYKAALDHMELAERLLTQVLGPEHPRRAEALIGLGVVRFMLRDYHGSLAAYQAAQPIQRAVLGASHVNVAVLLSNMGETELALGRAEAARRHFEEALEILEHRLGSEHADLALPLKGVGLAYLQHGQAGEAVAPLERARALRKSSTAASAPQELAEIEWALARALHLVGAGVLRAKVHAESALEIYRALGADSEPRVKEITRWLLARSR